MNKRDFLKRAAIAAGVAVVGTVATRKLITEQQPEHPTVRHHMTLTPFDAHHVNWIKIVDPSGEIRYIPMW